MNSNPKVLTYIPFHNYAEYIRECLDSILGQSYPNQEIVASDNGSTDNAPEIIKNEYPMVKLIQFPKYNSLNNPGLEKVVMGSNCEFYATISADDKLVPNFWEQTLPLFTSEDIGFVRVGCYQFSDKLPEGSEWRPLPWNNPLEILEVNKVFNTSPIRKKVLESVEGSDLDCFFSDWDFWIRAVLKGWKWNTLSKPMYWYRRHSKAWSYNYNASLDGPEYTYMRNKWMPTLRKFGIRRSTMATEAMIRGEAT